MSAVDDIEGRAFRLTKQFVVSEADFAHLVRVYRAAEALHDVVLHDRESCRALPIEGVRALHALSAALRGGA